MMQEQKKLKGEVVELGGGGMEQMKNKLRRNKHRREHA